MTRTASHNAHRNSAHAVAGYAGLALVALGAAPLAPLAVLPFYPQETGLAPGFIFPGVCAMLVGYLVYFFGARDAAALTLSRAEAAGVTVIIWISAIAVFSVPLVLSGVLTIPQAIFEATSGLTTTGLSVVDVAACPRIVLMHRGMMHYMGGVGLILVLTCIVSDSHGLKMYNAEGHTERLLSSTAGSARMVLVLYTGIILIGAVAYVIAGMPVFDAINISISAVSTGGFAVRPDSLASYGSIAIELITIILMIAGATNFLLNFMLLQGRFRAFARHAETAAFLGIIIAATAVVAALLFACGMEPTVPEALRVGLFQTVSVMTSTGLQTIPDFGQLVPSILYVLVFLMIVGGEAGSTSGGIKVYRLVVYSKGLLWSLRDRFGHRRRVYSNKINRFGKRIECRPEEVSNVHTFVGVYVGLLVICGFVFALFGASVGDAIFEAASCLGNTGIGVGFLHAESPSAVLIVASAAMLFGRLEIFPLIFGMRWMFQAVKEEVRYAVQR